MVKARQIINFAIRIFLTLFRQNYLPQFNWNMLGYIIGHYNHFCLLSKVTSNIEHKLNTGQLQNAK